MKTEIIIGDVRETLRYIDDNSIQTCITSPPYWGLRDYGEDGQIGLEQTPQEYVTEMVAVFREVWRVLADDGVLWLNLGDSYNGSGGNHQPHHKNDTGFQGKIGAEHHKGTGRNIKTLKPKDLVGIPWRVAFALQDDGWYLRQDIIWAKPNPMPESVRDRCTKSHEYLFMLTKSQRYMFDADAIREPSSTKGYETRNKRSVWSVPVRPFKGAHFAVMPEALVEPCVLAASKENDTVLDPFAGAGTVGVVAKRHNRNFIGIELNPEYAAIAQHRIENQKGNNGQ